MLGFGMRTLELLCPSWWFGLCRGLLLSNILQVYLEIVPTPFLRAVTDLLSANYQQKNRSPRFHACGWDFTQGTYCLQHSLNIDTSS